MVKKGGEMAEGKCDLCGKTKELTKWHATQHAPNKLVPFEANLCNDCYGEPKPNNLAWKTLWGKRIGSKPFKPPRPPQETGKP